MAITAIFKTWQKGNKQVYSSYLQELPLGSKKDIKSRILSNKLLKVVHALIAFSFLTKVKKDFSSGLGRTLSWP